MCEKGEGGKERERESKRERERERESSVNRELVCGSSMTSRPERERQEREQLLQRGLTLQDDVQEEYLEVEENYTAVADLFVEHRNLINESTDVLL